MKLDPAHFLNIRLVLQLFAIRRVFELARPIRAGEFLGFSSIRNQLENLNKFDPSDHNCLPSCNLISIHQESIHVSLMWNLLNNPNRINLPLPRPQWRLFSFFLIQFFATGSAVGQIYSIGTDYMIWMISKYTKMDQAEGDYMRKIAKKQAIKVNLKELVLVSTTLKVAELSKVKKYLKMPYKYNGDFENFLVENLHFSDLFSVSFFSTFLSFRPTFDHNLIIKMIAGKRRIF